MENVVLVSLDALRYTSVDKKLMPNLCRLNVRNDVYTVANWTLPAHTSVFTGKWPVEHGKRGPRTVVGEVAFPLLSEVMKARGYNTYAFTREKWFESEMGLMSRGWDVVVNQKSGCSSTTSKVGGKSYRDPLHMQDEIFEQLEEPFFLFLHTFLIHNYLVAEDIAANERWEFVPTRIADLVFEQVQNTNLFSKIRSITFDGTQNVLSDRDYALIAGLYAGHVKHTDRMLGQFISKLPKCRLIVMSDHGTLLGDVFEGKRCLFHRYGIPSHLIGRVPLATNFPLEGKGPLSLVGYFDLVTEAKLPRVDVPYIEFWDYNDTLHNNAPLKYTLGMGVNGRVEICNEEVRRVYEEISNRCGAV